MASLRAYGKVNELDQESLYEHGRTRKRITMIALSAIVLVVLIVSAVVGTCTSRANHRSSSSSQSNQPSYASIKAICNLTLYPNSCYASLVSAANSSQIIRPEELYKLSVQVTINELVTTSQYFSEHGGLKNVTDRISAAALDSCLELWSLALDHLNSSLVTNEASLHEEAVDDLKTWLSAAGTYQQTCIDGFENATDNVRQIVFHYTKNSTELISNSLAILSNVANILDVFKPRRLMSLDDGAYGPPWLSSKDRKLLLQSTSTKIVADAVVAKDGSGKYKTINDALKAVPDKSNERFVIYVKKGVYVENVVVEKNKWNVMMIGDGMDATVVSGSLNFVDGTPTFSTATFAVLGRGFVAKGMGFWNTAGAIKHQAVALMSTADQSLFYQCRINAFQDSLYTHSNRQFYRDCYIHGTVDFIFGNSAVVFQNCQILPKLPMLRQQNTITAQGKFDPNQNTGIAIHNCTILPSGDLNTSSVQTFLGRPWKNYSTTVYMRTMMGSFINPQGWLPWTGSSAPDTILYAEFENFGPGSSTKNRVKWKGLRKLDSKSAGKFTVKSFIKGDKWIPAAGISYNPDL